jgi:hypothetical protein
LTDIACAAAYLGGTQREVKQMNGMLQPDEFYRDAAERRQQEARQWARTDALGRLEKAAHDQFEQHPTRSRLLAVASPMAVALGILLVLI